MNLLEKHNKKIAIILCMISTMPIWVTVEAMEKEANKEVYIDERPMDMVSGRMIALDFSNDVKTKMKKNIDKIDKNKNINVIENTSLHKMIDIDYKFEKAQDEMNSPSIQQESSKPIEKPMDSPIEKPIEKPTEKPIETPIDYNSRIVEEAMKLVGVTDGQWCTEVVTQTLCNVGISASVLWPDQYVGYGYYVDASQAKPGNLIYYYNGGRGVDHIAIYIGNGLAVHGNYNGRTVIESAYVPNAGIPQFIQINF